MAEEKKYRVMLVDDDPDDRKYFAEALHDISPKAECITANDGAVALALLNDQSFVLPDFIFLDLRMPRVNGRNCLLQIKSTERLQQITIIVYTTSKEAAEAEDLQRSGAVHFISKPADTDEIYYLLSRILEEQGFRP